MAVESSFQPSAAETWHEIEALVQELAGFARADLAPDEFDRALLERAVHALAAAGGAVWVRDPAGRLRPAARLNLPDGCLTGPGTAAEAHERLLEGAWSDGQVTAVSWQERSHADGSSESAGDYLLLLGPVAPQNEPIALIELFQRPGTPQAARRGYLRFLEALSGLAADFHRGRRLQELEDRASRWDRFEQFTQRVHASLDLDECAYVIANEGRELLGCDRLSVATLRGRRARLAAVSGMDRIERRANLVRSLERLVETAAATGEPLWYPQESDKLPPQVGVPLQDYLEQSHARTLAVVPLTDRPQTDEDYTGAAAPQTIGCLVLERFDTELSRDVLEGRLQGVCRQSASALRNAFEYESLPLLPVLRLARKAARPLQARNLPKTTAVLAGLAAVVLALALIPAEFTVEGRGELQPQRRRHVFAASDGTVKELHADHGDRVEKGEPLVALRNSDLDFEFSRVLGEMQTARKQLATVRASRLETNPTDAEATRKYNELTAREEELKEQLKSLDKQLAILREQREELTLRSPLDGRVLTWDVAELLESRPVKRGQTLMTVGDLDGPWVLEMRVPDDEIGHVLSARRELRSDLRVSFMLATDPGTGYEGRIEKVAVRTDPGEADKTNGPSVLITVEFDKTHMAVLRPGATVVPRIHCGQRSVGYVWLHELWHAIQTRLLF